MERGVPLEEARSATAKDSEDTGHGLLSRREIIGMVTESNKKIKKKLGAAIVHLQLHRTAPLEGATRANDQGEIVCPKLGVVIGCIGIGIAS